VIRNEINLTTYVLTSKLLFLRGFPAYNMPTDNKIVRSRTLASSFPRLVEHKSGPPFYTYPQCCIQRTSLLQLEFPSDHGENKLVLKLIFLQQADGELFMRLLSEFTAGHISSMFQPPTMLPPMEDPERSRPLSDAIKRAER